MADRHLLDAQHLHDVLARVHAALAAHRTHIDELNVFPVPDGDTGTNMLMTVRSTLEALDGRGDEAVGATAGDLCRTVTRAAMRGARGNSGVILSQVLRALAETVAEHGPLDTRGFSRFLRRARALAYEAVADPVEGTILTAIAAAADEAERAHARGGAVADATAAVRDAVRAAVLATTDQLEALRVAGVVDAGARGFEVLVEALHGHVTGRDFDEAATVPAPVRRADGELALREAGSLTYRFEVQYLLDAPDEAAPELRRRLEELGDSVVVVASGGLSSVHVHTNDVGEVIEEGLRLGRPSRIEVTYFADQVAEAAAQRCAAAPEADTVTEAEADAVTEPAATAAAPSAGTHRRLGCIVVLPGAGLRAVAEDYGAVVVGGAAGQLPSVADLLNAIGGVQADRIVILPGHRNAVPTAQQASAVSVAEGGRILDVIEAADTVPAALSALAVCDPTSEPESVLTDMAEAADAVRSGEVVAAVRDATTPIGEVVEGQLLAVVGGDVVAAADDPLDALRRVADGCCAGGCELVTLVVGADVDADEASAAEDVVRRAADGAEVQVLTGGQRPSRYLLGAE